MCPVKDDGRFVWMVICLTAMGLASRNTAWAAKPAALQMPNIFTQTNEPTDEAQSSDTSVTTEENADGSTVEVVRERYPNGKVKIERQVTLDPQGNYVNHGTWKMLTTDGKVAAEGQYDMGKRVGTWTRWFARTDSPALGQFPFSHFSTPFVSRASFTDDAMDGEWLILDAKDRKCMQVSLTMGKRNGPLTIWLPSGKVYRQGTYDRGVPVGDFHDVNKTGELAVSATYVDGRKIVTKTTYHNHGHQKKTEEMFLAATTVEKTPDDFWNLRFADYGSEGKDLRHGPAKSWYENGTQQQSGLYKFDKKDGSFTFWHSNGQVASTGEYKDDIPDGTWVWWHENGQKASIGEYRSGALVGRWRWWNADGQLAKERVCDGTENVTSDPQEVPKLGRIADKLQLK